MVLNIVAVLEFDTAIDVAHDNQKLNRNRGPIVRGPIDLVGGFYEKFVLSWHNSVPFYCETRPFCLRILEGDILDSFNPRAIAIQLHGRTLNLCQALVSI